MRSSAHPLLSALTLLMLMLAQVEPAQAAPTSSTIRARFRMKPTWCRAGGRTPRDGSSAATSKAGATVTVRLNVQPWLNRNATNLSGAAAAADRRRHRGLGDAGPSPPGNAAFRRAHARVHGPDPDRRCSRTTSRQGHRRRRRVVVDATPAIPFRNRRRLTAMTACHAPTGCATILVAIRCIPMASRSRRASRPWCRRRASSSPSSPATRRARSSRSRTRIRGRHVQADAPPTGRSMRMRAVTLTDSLAPGSCRPWVAIERREIVVPARWRAVPLPLRESRRPPIAAGECRFALVIEGGGETVDAGNIEVPDQRADRA